MGIEGEGEFDFMGGGKGGGKKYKPKEEPKVQLYDDIDEIGEF